MIELTLTQALALYSAVIGSAFLGIWIFTELGAHRSHRQLEKQYLWRCVFCNYTYLDESAERLSECPRCKSINSLDDRGTRFIRPRSAVQPEAASVSKSPRRNPSRRKRPGQKRRGPRKR